MSKPSWIVVWFAWCIGMAAGQGAGMVIGERNAMILANDYHARMLAAEDEVRRLRADLFKADARCHGQ